MDKGKMQLAEERWLTNHGFTFEIVKEKPSKVVYDITRGGFTYRVELLKMLSDLGGYMKIVEETFEMAKKLAGQ